MESLKRDERGIADILSIAFMFLLVVFAGTMLHSWGLGPMKSSLDRQLQQKTEHLYKTLELVHVENYSISYLDAIAEHLVLAEPIVGGEYLREKVGNALEYLHPPGFGVWVYLACPGDGKPWDQVYPLGAGPPTLATKQFAFKGEISIIKAEALENRVVEVKAAVVIFEV